MENNIPRAEEFLNDIRYVTYSLDEKLITFAKLHVEAALLAASKNSEIIDVSPHQDGGDPGYFSVNEDSILNAYSLTNIK